MTATVWTIKALLKWTADHFAKQGLESPRLDAELLLAHVLECKRIDLIVRYEEVPTDTEKAAFRELVKKRLERCPTAYLIGTREFYLLPFMVNSAVLIPRPDTETLVTTAIDYLKRRPRATVLDLGTGSGCIAISLVHANKSVHATAVDLSPDAISVAIRNAKRHHVDDRMTFLTGDLFAPVGAELRFDLIVSNPPYIPPSEIETLAPEVKDHEPRVALDGGIDGLSFYRRLAMDSTRWLKQDGALMVEIGHTQETDVRTVFEQNNWSVSKATKDMAGRPRVLVARRT